MEHWLNGRKILEFEAWTDDWFARKNSGKWETAPEYGLAHRGVLCLQDHGYPASFRNLKIKELPRKAGREVELFNGKDLTGWEAYGTEKWYVDKDGNMVCESGPDKEYGYLATREYYNDFDLTLEFKQLANGNSGVFFRSFVEPPVKVHGWQCEVAPKGFDTAGIYESYGRGWLVQIPDEKEDILREGEWNTLRLKVQGDRVQTWLNGVRDACTWYDALKADGKFGASTQRAVQEFQLKNKMNMDGKVGQNTWNVLYTRYTAKHGLKVPYPGIVLHTGSSGGTVRLVQQKLNSLGERLNDDGKYGAATAAAVQRFQRRNGLPADGSVGYATWEKMF